MKLDERKELSACYPTGKRATAPHTVDVPAGVFFMVDGHGDPNSSSRFEEATKMLFAVSYAAKFASKAQGQDYAVMPLEGLWWAEDMRSFTAMRRDEWMWTLAIRQPAVVGDALLKAAVEQALSRGKLSEAQASELRVERYEEGQSVQVLHIGPYADEPPVIAAMHEWAHAQGLRMRGKHHEIYLGDPRKAAPEKLKTVLRQPVEAA